MYKVVTLKSRAAWHRLANMPMRQGTLWGLLKALVEILHTRKGEFDPQGQLSHGTTTT